MEKVIAGIVTFNPDIDRLKKNIEAIKGQVSYIVISDNASLNIEEIKELVKIYSVTIIENEENKGIAHGLNECMKFAQDNEYDWVITLDQDSICPLNILEKANHLMKRKDIAMVVPLLKESNSGEICYLGERDNGQDWQEVKKCITSASITNIAAWRNVDGFDEELFIDYVDYDFAMKVILKNYKIIRMNNIFLDHQIGKSEIKKILNKKVRVAHHSAFRKYYIARNIIIYIKRYWRKINFIQEIMRLLKVLLLITFFEENKCEKMKAYFKGIKNGIGYNINK